MLKSNFEFEILINGSRAKEYYHEGSYYIEGKEGSKFSLRMKNNSNGRVLFVPTVDGLSIMSGKEASFKSQGYIVNSYDALTIDGWRTSDDKVAEFFFSSPKQSYAKKLDKSQNLGVIGCAIFKEKERVRIIEKVIIEKEYIPYPKNPWHFDQPWNNNNPRYLCDSSVSCSTTSMNTGKVSLSSISSGSSVTNMMSADLGTGFGQDKYSPVVKVDFDKEASPEATFSIFYNTREKLEELGVEFRKPVYVTPSAFPNEEGYCKRPN